MTFETDEQYNSSTGEPNPEMIAITESISNRHFTEWYQEQQIKQNILEGKAYFNGPSPPKPPDQHTPSKLLQCHRKVSYSRQNAPREDTPPEGLFWVGSEFEEQIIVPFLQDVVTTDSTYVTNSLWVDTEIQTDGPTLHLRGSTDPAIVNSDADPLFLTEIKTTTSVENLTGPKPHHRAQLHAYLYALDQDHDYPIEDGLILYGSRKTLNIKSFHVSFDPEFWDTVVEWMSTQTQYQDAGELPPANPERDWECNYCSFKHRCGEADTPYSDIGHGGLLPLFDEYDRQNLEEYLEAHSAADAKLTPTLAHKYPELLDEYDAYAWSCPACNSTYEWDAVEWDGVVSNPPVCPSCLDSDEFVTLSGPSPTEQ
jgi:CRISPR/Cas system-associated exonuclease Cas4 (RecB family)